MKPEVFKAITLKSISILSIFFFSLTTIPRALTYPANSSTLRTISTSGTPAEREVTAALGKPEDLPDSIIENLGISRESIRYIRQNKSGHKTIITEDKKLFVIDKEGGLITKGSLKTDKNHDYFIFQDGIRICRLKLEDSQVSVIMERTEAMTLINLFVSPDGHYIFINLIENNMEKIRIYDIPEIEKPQIVITDSGKPSQAKYNDGITEVTFRYVDGRERTFDIQTGFEAVTYSTAPAGDLEAEAESLGVTADWLKEFCAAIFSEPFSRKALVDDYIDQIPFEKQIAVINWAISKPSTFLPQESLSGKKVRGKYSAELPAEAARYLGLSLQVAKEQAGRAKPEKTTAFIQPPINPAAESFSEKIKRLNPDSAVKEFVERVRLASPEQLQTIIEKFKEKQKAKPAIGSAAADFDKAVEARRNELAQTAKPAEAKPEEEITIAPEAAEPRKEIELLPEGAELAKGPKAAKPSAEKITDFLKKAMEDFRIAKTPEGVDTILKKLMKEPLVPQVAGLKGELTDLANKRKHQLKKLDEYTKQLDSAMDSVVSIEKGDKRTQEWFKNVEDAFYDEIAKILEDEELKPEREKETSFYTEVTTLISQKKKLFYIWYNIIFNAVSAPTFSDLVKLENELKDNFGESPVRMKAPQAYIERRRKTLTKRKEACVEKIEYIAIRVGEEYIRLDRILTAFDEKFKVLEDVAKAETRFKDLKLAAQQTEEVVVIKVVKGRKQEKTKRSIRPLLGFRLRRLKEPLREVVTKRAEFIEQLKKYTIARRAILDNFKPAELCLTQEEFDKKLDSIIFDILKKILVKVLEKETDQATRLKETVARYIKFKSPAAIEKFIRERDINYLQPLCKRLKIEFEPMLKGILNIDKTAVDSYVEEKGLPRTFLPESDSFSRKVRGLLPATPLLESELKALGLIDVQA